MKKTMLVVIYNHDNNTKFPDKELMAIVESKKDFYVWLKQHNKAKLSNWIINNVSEREFTLVPLELFNKEIHL